MPAFASILSPVSYGNAIELGNRQWRKKILPVGEIEYQGRTLRFTKSYNDGLADAFRSRAYDAVSFQLAPGDNSHTNDPERHRGLITDMTSEPDGLWITLQPTPRGEQVLRENPYLGVSARIVEQYQRADGQFYPAAIQHVLGTLDPRIPGLGPWQAVDMANSPQVTIDLSTYSFSGEPGPLTAGDADELTDQELADLLDALEEAENEEYSDPDQLTDAELEYLLQDIDADGTGDAFSEFDEAFSIRAATDQARAAAAAEPPARRTEDRVAQVLRHAAQGVYHGQSADFAAESAAAEIMLSNGGYGPCGAADEYGRCSARFHALECSHGVSTGPDQYAVSLASADDTVALESIAPAAIWGDPHDPADPGHPVPQETIELAHELAIDWGLDSTPGSADAQAYLDLLRAPSQPVTVADALLASAGYERPAPERPVIDVSGLRRAMGI